MTKKFIVIISSVVLAIIIFVGGFYCGLKFFAWNFNVSELTKAYVELIPLQSNIEALDKKDYDSIRTSVNLRIDGEILRVYNALGESKNKEDIHKAKKWLAHIAKYRKQFPAEYPKYPNTDQNVQKNIAAILAEFADYK